MSADQIITADDPPRLCDVCGNKLTGKELADPITAEECTACVAADENAGPDADRIITTDDLEHLRRVVDGIVVVDADGQPIVRSKLHYDGPDPLYDRDDDQIIVLDGDPAWDAWPDVTDAELAEDLSSRWGDLVSDARERHETDRA